VISPDLSRFDFARHLTGAELTPEHSADFQRLIKDLCYGGQFQLLIVVFNDWNIRENLIRHIDQVLEQAGMAAGRIELNSAAYPSVATVEAELVRLAVSHRVVHLIGGESWFNDTRLDHFNLRREAIAQSLTLRLVLWLDETTVRRFAQLAPDWWAWRGGVFSFCVKHRAVPIAPPTPQLGPMDNRSLAKRSRRISELRTFLDTEPPPPDELALPLWDELAGLYFHLGEWDKALRIHTEEQLPVYERLGDELFKAVTLGKIADIRQAWGQWDEALRIYQDEVLPAFERLDDMYHRAVTLGKIADIRQARGHWDEALSIYDEVLPVFERLGDVRSKAIALVNIADILQAQGLWDEALGIYQDEVLPIFERLVDVRSKAVALGKIADILQARGQWDETLRIRTEDELPVYERLGDVREKLVVLFKIAHLEWQQDRQAEAFAHLAEAYRLAQQLNNPIWLAVVSEEYGKLLCEQGKLEQGLTVLETAHLAALQLGQVEKAECLAELMQSFA
jgi:tetratricopeptide (TPR) repeat protein